MPLFMCSACGCWENTALSNYAVRRAIDKLPPVCSACDPEIRQWHGEFPRQSAVGMALGTDGFLYGADDFKHGAVRHTRLDRILTEADLPKKSPADVARE
jgi:hypothetical protein